MAKRIGAWIGTAIDDVIQRWRVVLLLWLMVLLTLFYWDWQQDPTVLVYKGFVCVAGPVDIECEPWWMQIPPWEYERAKEVGQSQTGF